MSFRVERSSYMLFSLLSISFISWNISGIFGAIPGFRAAALLVNEVLLLVLYVTVPRKKNPVDKIWLQSLIWYCVAAGMTFLFEAVYGQNNSILTSMSFVYPLAFFFIGKIYSKKKSDKQLRFGIFVFDVLAKMMVTLYFYQSDHTIMKMAINTYYATADGLPRMVIQYAFMYFMPVLIILFTSIIVNNNRLTRNKFWSWTFLVGLLIFLVMSQVTMLIILVPFLLLIYINYKKIGKISWIIVILAVVALVIYYNIVPILQFALTLNFLGDAVKLRLKGMIAVIQLGSSYITSTFTGNMLEGDSVVNRIMAYQLSADAFIKNFFLGYATNGHASVGFHSVWLDHVGRYGIFVALPLYISIGKSIKWLCALYGDFRVEIRMVASYLVLAGLLSTINLTTVFLVLMIVVPMFAENDNSRNNIKSYQQNDN